LNCGAQAVVLGPEVEAAPVATFSPYCIFTGTSTTLVLPAVTYDSHRSWVSDRTQLACSSPLPPQQRCRARERSSRPSVSYGAHLHRSHHHFSNPYPVAAQPYKHTHSAPGPIVTRRPSLQDRKTTTTVVPISLARCIQAHGSVCSASEPMKHATCASSTSGALISGLR
jgi:hypothetical protein